MAADTHAFPPTIGRYVIEAELGRGAMGVVYRARDPRLDRPVALKTLLPAAGADPGAVRELKERFLNEGRAAGRLSHRNIVAVYDADEDPATGTAYLAMELIEGEDLRQVMARGIAPPELVSILAQVASALDHAHLRGVVHRDVKPANVFVDAAGEAKLGDFGIARLGDSTLTQTGQFVGSPAYMSPEQVMGRVPGPSTDIFSLGVLLYEGLTGRKPFEGDSLISTTHAIVNEQPRRPTELRPTLSPALDDVIARALAKDPEQRHPTATALAADAAAALERPSGARPRGGAATIPSGTAAGKSRLPLALAAGAVGVVALALVAWFALGGEDRDVGGASELADRGRATSAAVRETRVAPNEPPPPVPKREPERRPAAPPPPVEVDEPRREERRAVAGGEGRLNVELHTLVPGTFTAEVDGSVVGRFEARQRGVGRVKSLKNPKFEFREEWAVPAGRRTLTLRFARDNGDTLVQRSVRDAEPGRTMKAKVDIGVLGRDMDVRWE